MPEFELSGKNSCGLAFKASAILINVNTDGSVSRLFFRSDCEYWQGTPVTTGFI